MIILKLFKNFMEVRERYKKGADDKHPMEGQNWKFAS
jgi:hypothetical protein